MNPASPSPFSAAGALAWREIVRFYRQRNRIIGSVATPVVFWLLFGLGLNRNFTQGEGAGAGFLAYFMPGSLALTVLFTAIYSSISVIEDRREGFLQLWPAAIRAKWLPLLPDPIFYQILHGFWGDYAALAALCRAAAAVSLAELWQQHHAVVASVGQEAHGGLAPGGPGQQTARPRQVHRGGEGRGQRLRRVDEL